FRVLQHRGPFVLVRANVAGHVGVEVRANAKSVVHDDLPQAIEAALEVLLPGGCALQAVGVADVEHEVPVDDAVEGLVVDVLHEQLRVLGREAAVAAHVDVPALLRSDDAHVLAARLSAFAGAAGDSQLELVRTAQAPVPDFECDGHSRRVVDAEAAPCGTHAGLHRTEALAVGVTGLKPGIYQALPNGRQLLHARAEHVDALAAGDLGIEPELLGDLADHDELLWRDLPTGNARDH